MAMAGKTFVAVPTYGHVSARWTSNYASLSKPLGSFGGSMFDDTRRDIAEKRNHLIQKAIDSKAETIFFLGDDVHPPQMTLPMLLERWRQDYKAICGIYWTKSPPIEPIIYRGYMKGAYWDWKVGDFFKLDMAGVDCLLLDVKMLKEMGPPWFSLDWKFTPEQGHVEEGGTTEDFYFYTRLHKLGVQLWCDSRVQCHHEDRETGALFGLTPGMPQWRKLPTYPDIKGKLIADIGSGSSYNELSEENTVVRFDFNESCKPDVLCDARTIPEPADKYDVVYSAHVLEHFTLEEGLIALREWIRILKPGGKLLVRVPNLQCPMSGLLEGKDFSEYEMQMIYGLQSEPGQYHYFGYIPVTLRNLAREVGNLKDYEIKGTNWKKHGYHSELTLTATKIESSEAPALSDYWEEKKPEPVIKIKASRKVKKINAKRNGGRKKIVKKKSHA